MFWTVDVTIFNWHSENSVKIRLNSMNLNLPYNLFIFVTKKSFLLIKNSEVCQFLILYEFFIKFLEEKFWFDS